MLIEEVCRRVQPLDPSLRTKAQTHLSRLTKPQGSLGRDRGIGGLLCDDDRRAKTQHPAWDGVHLCRRSWRDRGRGECLST